MKSVFEKKYLDSFSSSKEEELSQFDIQIDEVGETLSTVGTGWPHSDASPPAWPPMPPSVPPSMPPSIPPSVPLPRPTLSTAPKLHSRFSTLIPSLLPSELVSGKRWLGLLVSFAVGVLLGGLVVFLILSARPPKTVVREKVVTKTEIVYRDAPLASEDVSDDNNHKNGKSGGGTAGKGRRGSAKKGNVSREQRKQQLLASLNVGGTNTGGTGGKGSSGSGLSSSQMNTVVSKNRSSLQMCYERELKKGTASSFQDVKVTFHVTVGKSGTVTAARLTGDGARLPELKKCLSSAVNKWVFPASSGTSAVQFPIVFTPSR